MSSGGPYGSGSVPPVVGFMANAGLMSPGHSFSLLTQRHMHLYGTTREHLAHVAINQREMRHQAADGRCRPSRSRWTTTSTPA